MAGQLLVTVFILTQSDCTDVKYICIDASAQRKGAGTKLMREIVTSSGLAIYLESAHTDSALSFYRRLGFESLGTVKASQSLVTLTAMKLEN